MFKKMLSWKWVKKFLVKRAKGLLKDENVDKWIDDIVKKVDSGLTDEQERKHLNDFKKFIRPLIFAYMDLLSGK